MKLLTIYNTKITVVEDVNQNTFIQMSRQEMGLNAIAGPILSLLIDDQNIVIAKRYFAE